MTLPLKKYLDDRTDLLFILGQEHCSRTHLRVLSHFSWLLRDDRFFDGGKKDFESGAFAELARNQDLPAALFHDAVNNCQAESRPFTLFLCGEERLEDVSLSMRIHSHARIAHCKHDVTPWSYHGLSAGECTINFDVGSLDGQLAPFGHSIARINRQVE